MAIKGLQKKTEADLKKELRDKQRSLQAFRFESTGSRTRNVKEGSLLRKDIARILTELNKRR